MTPEKSDHYALGDDIGPEMEAIVRVQGVTRWHMLGTTRYQTLAEHSANVALLVYYIAKRCPAMYFGPPDVITVKALVHDMPEVYTGDIPSHTKKWFGDMTEAEKVLTPRMFRPDLGPTDKWLVKLCDTADGIRFIRAHAINEKIADHACRGLEVRMKSVIEEASGLWPDAVVEFVTSTLYKYMDQP